MAYNTSSKLISGSANLTISGGEASLTTNTSITASAAAATATVTINASKPSAGETIVLISTDGTSKTYTAVAGSATVTSNQFSVDTNYDDVAFSLETAIEHSSGHNGKILVSRTVNVLALTQAAAGSAGNSSITTNMSNTAADGAFVGGSTGAVVAAELDISGDIDIDGVSNLDNTDIDGSLTVDGAIDLNATTLDIDASAAVTIDGVGVSIDSVGVAANFTVASDGAGEDLTIAVTGATDSSVVISSTGTGADAINIDTTAGSIDIDSADNITVGAADEISITTTSADGHISLVSAHTAGVALHVDADANAGSIVDVDAGILDVDVTGVASIDSGGTLSLATANSSVAVSIGHTTSETTVNDNLNVTGDLDITGGLSFDGGTAVTSIDADMSSVSGSDDTLASAKAIKSYIDSTVTAQDLDATGDSGTIAIDLDSETLTIAGGTGATTVGSGNGITVNVDAAQTGITSVTNAGLALGRGADNQIKFATDNLIIFRVAGVDGVTMKGSGEIEATSLDIEGDIDINGTSNLDNTDIDGTFTMDGTTFDVNASGLVTVDGAGVSIDSAGVAANFTVASDGAAEDLTIALTGATDSSIVISSTGTGADAINIDTTAGSIDIDSADNITIDAADDISITTGTADGLITLHSAHTAGQAVLIDANANAGSILDIDAGILDIDVQAATTIDAVGIALGAGSGELDLTTTGTLDINANAMDMDLTDSSSITITSSEAAEDLTIEQVGANDSSIIIQAAGDGSDAIKLNASAGSIDIDSADNITIDASDDIAITTGTVDGLITLHSAHTAGQAILIDANANAGSILDIDAGILDIDVQAATTIDAVGIALGAGSGELDLTTTGTLDINANAMDMDLTDSSSITITSSEAAEDLTIEQVGANDSSIIIQAAGNGADAIKLNASAGSIDIDSADNVTIDAADEIVVTTTSVDGHISLVSAHTAGQAIHIDANANVGSILDIDAGILDIDVDDAITIDAADEIVVTTTSADGHIALVSAHTAGVALHIDADADAGSIVDIDAGILDIDVTGAATIDAASLTVTTDTATFTSANTTDPLFIIKNTTNDTVGARLRLVKDKGAAGADFDQAGIIEFFADDDAQDNIKFGGIEVLVKDASNGSEGGEMVLTVATHDGENQPGLVISDGNLEDEVDVSLGSGALSVTTGMGYVKATSGFLIPEAKSIDIQAPLLPTADHTATGLTAQMLAGGAIAAFQTVCIHTTTGEVVISDSNAIGTMPVIGIAPAAISDTNTGTILLQGFIRDDTFNWTLGGIIYASETAGAMTQTAPTTSGAFVQALGIALSADVVYFNPSLTLVEVA